MLANNSTLGPYRIVRPLGRGGMGVVYEADDVESGRRVALKVLPPMPPGTEERERFEREGRLAASLNHPHCVFVFAASEIDGYPVIAMEMMQETLADRLKRERRLAPADAVDAALQVIAGLEAAATAGILHRDVKPSNCFVDADGVVKIGDFGISRSQRPTDETALSTQGPSPATPAYASPEQLRGGALDVRADIYSVCATLYELLTGRRPFDAPDLMALLMAVATDAPAPPHVVEPAVPKGLSRAVIRGLAKQPERRFADYAALARALEPYASTPPTPATLAKRCLAGVIDWLPILLASIPIALFLRRDWYAPAPLLLSAVLEVAYFTLCESVWAASAGKAICGVTVVRQNGAPALPSQVLLRAVTYVFAPVLPLLALGFVSPSLVESQIIIARFGSVPMDSELTARLLATPSWLHSEHSALGALMLLLLFAPARWHNGYAAVHDRISRTRVIERGVRVRAPSRAQIEALAPPEIVRHLGPFAVLSGRSMTLPEGWVPGFDERLRRRVWIREVAAGTPPISSARRAINRATRLRWLAGRRSGDECWDVFEAAEGVPLNRAVFAPRSWTDVRLWLLDLARECQAQREDDQPPRRLDRVWILDSGGAKLLDDPAFDTSPGLSDQTLPQFLQEVVGAVRGSTRPAAPWPLSAHQLLQRLTADADNEAGAIVALLEPTMQRPADISRARRAVSLLIPVLIPLLWSATLLFLLSVGDQTSVRGAGPNLAAPVDTDSWRDVAALSTAGLVAGLYFVAGGALANALLWRGGVMRLLGLEFVKADGRPASRVRVVVRTIVTWSPLLLLALIDSFRNAPAVVARPDGLSTWGVSDAMLWGAPLAVAIMIGGAVVAIVTPSRGLQDRLAGTWIVPR